MRLDRFVSEASGCSRKQAKTHIQRGHLAIDGDVARSASAQVSDMAVVTLLGRVIGPVLPTYVMLNKPAGLVSASSDADNETVMSLLPDSIVRRSHIVGRLDKDTTGLLLITDDGEWTHAITSPKKHCAKVYRAELAEALDEQGVEQLRQGILLKKETLPTLPALVDVIADKRVRLTIEEGRYHQVKRMFAALGNRVTALHRESIGGLVLDSALAPGEWRELTKEEQGLVFV